jgi:hypothetical protein
VRVQRLLCSASVCVGLRTSCEIVQLLQLVIATAAAAAADLQQLQFTFVLTCIAHICVCCNV